MRRIDAEVDGDGRDAFVRSRHPVGFCFDLLPHLVKICELFGLAVQKLSIFWKRLKKKIFKKKEYLAIWSPAQDAHRDSTGLETFPHCKAEPAKRFGATLSSQAGSVRQRGTEDLPRD